jgi:hypothetical protein
MSEFLSETEGCDLLARLFRARGYAIQRNVLFREYGVEFHIDGWDAKARVGFEFLTSEDDDHDDLTLDEYQALALPQQKGELSLFILDEVEPLSAADLTASAHEFLDEVAEAMEARRNVGSTRKKAALKKAASKKKARAVPAKKKAGQTAGRKKASIATKSAAAKATGVKRPGAVKKKTATSKKVGKKPAAKKGRAKR